MAIPFLSRWLVNRKQANDMERLSPEVSAFIRASLPKGSFGGRALNTPTDYNKLVIEYSGWAYACARKNATAAAQVPMRLYRGVPRDQGVKVRKTVPVRKVDKRVKDRMFETASLVHHLNKAVDVEEVLEHPWFELLRKANKSLNGFDLRQLTVLFKQVTGNAYWLLSLDAQGRPEDIWPLPSQFVRIVPNIERYVEQYEYGLTEPIAKYDPANIVHFKYPSISSIYYGQGPLEAAFTSASLNEDFDEYERALLDNMAMMPAIFAPKDGPIGKEGLKRLRQDIERNHKGYKKAGRFGLLGYGLEVLPVSWNPKDINYAVGMKLTKEKIAGVFGVPLSKLTVEDVNRANAEAGNYSYMKDTIQPECTSNADMVNQEIMPLYDDKLFVCHDDCVPEDKEFALKTRESNLKTGVTWINEVREEGGLDPIDGGDEPLLSGTLKPLNQIIAEPEPMPIPGVFGNPDNPDGNPDDDSSDATVEQMFKLAKRGYYYNAEPTDFEDESQCRCKTIIHDPQEAFVRDAVAHWMTETQRAARPFITEVTVSSPGAVDNAIPWQSITATADMLVKPRVVDVFLAGADTAAKRIQPGAAFNMRSPEAIRWAEKYTGDRITGTILPETKQAVRNIVSNRLTEGMNPQELAKRLRSEIGLNERQVISNDKFRQKLIADGFSTSEVNAGVKEYTTKQIRQRAEMIARTESAMAYAEGNIEAYKNAGITKMELSPAADACKVCQPLRGKIYSVLESRGVIPVHPHCRCDWLPVIEP